MVILGITGGMGAGKSEVLAFLREKYGAVTLFLDEVSRELLSLGGEAVEPVKELLGEEIIGEDGRVNRALVASMVFSDPVKLAGLNGIMHPLVKAKASRVIEEERGKGTALLAVEAALLLEDHYDAICDEVWYIYADAEVRKRRLMESRHYSPERIADTFARQLSDEEFRRRCSVVIDNSGSFEAAKAAMDARLKVLLG